MVFMGADYGIERQRAPRFLPPKPTLTKLGSVGGAETLDIFVQVHGRGEPRSVITSASTAGAGSKQRKKRRYRMKDPIKTS